MDVSDITIEVRSAALGKLGQIDLDYVTDLKIIKRFCNVGSWTMSLPAEYDMAQELAKTGRGLIVTGPNDVILLSGGMDTYEKKQDTGDPIGRLFFTGYDDMIHLSDALAWPEPGNDNSETQSVAYDVRTGPAETLLREYLMYNIGDGNIGHPAPWATADRAVWDVTVDEVDLQRGNITTANPRFDPLGQVMGEIALVGGLGFDMQQTGDLIVLKVYEPQDKSDEIRMDIENDMLDSTSYGFGSPNGTRAIVAGQGEGVDRRFIKVTSTESLDAEIAWRRKIERFKDRRDTSEDADLIQEGVTLVTENGKTIVSLSVVPSDEVTMVYAKDWFLGDLVGVVVDGEELSAIVTEAIIAIDASGVRTAATIGSPVGFDYESKLIDKQQNQERRIAFLEKNAEVGKPKPIDWADLIGKPLTFPSDWSSLGSKPLTFAPIIGSAGNQAVAGNDSRLTNARTPLGHTHNLTDVNIAEIGGSIDLNSLRNTGFYVQSQNADATSGSNYPEDSAGFLDVRTVDNFTWHHYHCYGSVNKVYVRTYYNGTWYPWQKLGAAIDILGGKNGAMPVTAIPLLQSGMRTVAVSGGLGTLTFQDAFPSSCANVFLTAYSGTQISPVLNASTLSKTSCQCFFSGVATGSVVVGYLAVGW